MTTGKIITARRKELNLNQKELAAKILKADGTPISAQYLNDIEHDRRSLPAGYLMDRFAEVLQIDKELLYYYAGEIPEDSRVVENPAPEKILDAYKAFRAALAK